MKHCEICKVEVDTHSDICPLCYNKLIQIEEKTTPELFELKPKENTKKKRVMVAKIFMLISIIAVLTCLFVNYQAKGSHWSLVVLMSVVWLWVLVAHTIMSRDTPFKKIFFELLSVSALLLVTNYVFSSNDWLVHYVYPSMSIAVATVLSFIVMCSKNRKKVIYSFFAIEILLLLVSIFFLVFKLDDFVILNQINIFFTGIVEIAYLLFGWKSIKEEFVRKFHI